MKITLSSFRPIFFLFVAIVILTASVAVQAWVSPPTAPPTCPSNVDGCNAPIHVGTNTQYKSGAFAIGKTSGLTSGYLFDVNGAGILSGLLVSQNLTVNGRTTSKYLKVTGDTAPAVGDVLVAKDTAGEVGWGTAGSGGSAPTYSIVSTPITILERGGAGLAEVDASVKIEGSQGGDMCFIVGMWTKETDGSTPSSCYITQSTTDRALWVHAGADDKVQCKAQCIRLVSTP